MPNPPRAATNNPLILTTEQATRLGLTPTTPNPPRKIRCRYLRATGEQCPNEALDHTPDAHIVLCLKHIERAIRTLTEARDKILKGE